MDLKESNYLLLKQDETKEVIKDKKTNRIIHMHLNVWGYVVAALSLEHSRERFIFKPNFSRELLLTIIALLMWKSQLPNLVCNWLVKNLRISLADEWNGYIQKVI